MEAALSALLIAGAFVSQSAQATGSQRIGREGGAGGVGGVSRAASERSVMSLARTRRGRLSDRDQAVG